MMAETVQISIRVTTTLLEALQALAYEQRRTLAQVARLLLEDGVAAAQRAREERG